MFRGPPVGPADPRRFMFEQYKDTDASLLIRTDFADDVAWAELCDLVQQPAKNDFRAMFVCVSDPRLAKILPEALAKQMRQDLGRSVTFFIADARALHEPEHPVLCVRTDDALIASWPKVGKRRRRPITCVRAGHPMYQWVKPPLVRHVGRHTTLRAQAIAGGAAT